MTDGRAGSRARRTRSSTRSCWSAGASAPCPNGQR